MITAVSVGAPHCERATGSARAAKTAAAGAGIWRSKAKVACRVIVILALPEEIASFYIPRQSEDALPPAQGSPLAAIRLRLGFPRGRYDRTRQDCRASCPSDARSHTDWTLDLHSHLRRRLRRYRRSSLGSDRVLYARGRHRRRTARRGAGSVRPVGTS